MRLIRSKVVSIQRKISRREVYTYTDTHIHGGVICTVERLGTFRFDACHFEPLSLSLRSTLGEESREFCSVGNSKGD